MVVVEEFWGWGSEMVRGGIEEWERGMVVGGGRLGKGVVEGGMDLGEGWMIGVRVGG